MKRILLCTALLFYCIASFAKVNISLGGGVTAISNPRVKGQGLFREPHADLGGMASFALTIPAEKWDIGIRISPQRQRITNGGLPFIIAKTAMPVNLVVERNFGTAYAGVDVGYMTSNTARGVISGPKNTYSSTKVIFGLGSGFNCGAHVGLREPLHKHAFVEIQAGMLYASANTKYKDASGGSIYANYLIYYLSAGLQFRLFNDLPPKKQK